MMSIVPEEGSLTPSEAQEKSPTPPNPESKSGINTLPAPRKRTTETLANIKPIGSIQSLSTEALNRHSLTRNSSQLRKSQPVLLTSFRHSEQQQDKMINNLEQDRTTNELTLTISTTKRQSGHSVLF